MATKTALCIGINDYPGTDSDLSGCVNDAHDWGAALETRDFSVDYLIDGKATRAAMVDAMTQVVDGASSGDVVVITYSGHGTWQPDDDGDEPDFRDEALCPHDLVTEGSLLDDDLYTIFSRRARGVRLVFLSDSCHSGSVARFAPSLDDSPADRVTRYLPPAVFLPDDQIPRARAARTAPARGLPRATALLMSGCTDLEYSYDATFGGRPNGAFTRVALHCLDELGADVTYRQWHEAIAARLPTAQYPQSPQIVGTSSQKDWPVFG